MPEWYGLLAILLLIAGLTLLLAEIFIPSGGILAIMTALVLALAVTCAYAAWYERYPAAWWTFCGLIIVMIPTTIGTGFYYFPRTPIGRDVLLEAPPSELLEPHREETARLEKLVGRDGTAVSPLTPGGIVLVDNARHHAVTEGLILDAGTPIFVLEVRGTRLLVAPSEGRSQDAVDTASNDPAERPFDFDLPTE